MSENHAEGPDRENMVLRTVFLPPYMDQMLAALARKSGRSKGEIIRRAIDAHISAEFNIMPEPAETMRVRQLPAMAGVD